MLDYLTGYLYVLVFLLVGAVIVFGGLIASKLLAPRGHKTAEKLRSYESGEEPLGTGQVQFPVRFYIFALLFVVFDVEAVFMYPWAVVLGDLGWPGFVTMAVFGFTLALGLVYVWKKGALDWSRE